MLEEIAPNLSIQRHSLNIVGCKMGRVVSLIRLNSGKVIVHSTAKFSPKDIHVISEYGDPAWMIEATNFHDTYAQDGRQAFADIPYFTPSGFKYSESLSCSSMKELPAEWGDEIKVVRIDGMPNIQEHAVYHFASKTLIVADLFFNIAPDSGWWTRNFLRATVGISEYPGISRLYKHYIKDREAFANSMQKISSLDFEKIVVAHGKPIVDDAKKVFVELLAKHGLDGAV